MPSKSKGAILKTLVILISSLFCQHLFASHALPEFKAQYAVIGLGMKLAEADYQLFHTETGYRFTQNTGLHGMASFLRSDSVSAVSIVDRVGEQLLLKKHTYKQTSKKKKVAEDLTIQWDTTAKPANGKISGKVRDKTIDLQTDTAVWDVLSFQIPLMIDAKPDKKDYHYNAIIEGNIDTYKFVLKSSKEIHFAGKDYLALQMVRTHPRKDRQLHVWLAPELHNIPLIIENYRNGKVNTRAKLENLQFNNDKPLNNQSTDNPVNF